MMRRSDAAAFLVTAFGVLITNAVFAVAAGCAVFGARFLVERYHQRKQMTVSAAEPVKIGSFSSAKTSD